MKKLLAAIFTVIAAACLTSGCAQAEKYVIELDGNPTTGYTWVYTMKPKGIVKEVNSDYISEETGLVGEGGKFMFIFEGKKEGDVELIFEYLREFEEDVPPERTITYSLSVDDKNNITENDIVESDGQSAAADDADVVIE